MSVSLRQRSSLRRIPFLARSILPVGAGSTAVTIPAEVRDELDLETGEPVDLVYNRDEAELTVIFDRDPIDSDS